ncbi:MAG: helix-turn-helix domain-containing protein [Phenylobacterium sp.]
MALTHEFGRGDDGLAGVVDRLGVTMRFAKHAQIFVQDDPVELMFRVVEGAVRTTRLTCDGRRQVGGFYYPGELFGLEIGEARRFSAEAMVETVVRAVRRSALRGTPAEGRFERDLLRAVAAELDRTQDHLLLLGRKTAQEKVASFLQHVAERAGRPAVELPMSRQDMADFLGLTIETVSRMLTQLQSSNVVEFISCRRFRVCNGPALDRLAA